MVRGKDDRNVSILDLCEEEGEKILQITVQAVVHVLDLHRFGPVGLADVARSVEADIQQVGCRILSEFVLGDELLGKTQHGRIAGRRPEQPLVVILQHEPSAFGTGRFTALAPLLGKDDLQVARVDIAFAVEQRPPLRGGVGEVVALVVAAVDPFGNPGGIVERGDPVAPYGIEPEDLAAAAGQHDGRGCFGGDGCRAAFGVLPAEGLRKRGCHEMVGSRAFAPVGERDDAVRGVVHPPVADYAVGRGQGARRERGQRDGGGGLLEIVAAVRIDRAALHQAAESPFAEVGVVAPEILGAHRPDNDLDDQPGRLGAEAPGGREEGYGE